MIKRNPSLAIRIHMAIKISAVCKMYIKVVPIYIRNLFSDIITNGPIFLLFQFFNVANVKENCLTLRAGGPGEPWSTLQKSAYKNFQNYF